MTPENIVDQLIRDEDEVLHLYYVNGIPHVGVGINLACAPLPAALCAQMTITPSLSRALLTLRLRDVLIDLGHIPWLPALDDIRRAVLVNVCFNVGFKGLLAFHNMLAAMQRGDWTAAAAELRDSDAWRSTENHNRYERLARQLETGRWV